MITASKTFLVIMRVFTSIILLFAFQISFACGWEESAEASRLVLFKSERNGFLKLHYFCYSANNFHEVSEVSNKDQEINCLEWQKKIGTNVATADIYTILYETDSDKFQEAYQNKILKQTFAKNSFIATLLLSKNKAFLDYLVFAKKLEYNNVPSLKWESWSSINSYQENVNNVGLGDYEKKIASIKDPFLKQRYAFLILRDRFYRADKVEVIRLYDTYFAKDKNTILEPWALYYKALCIDDYPLQNYLLSKVFASCDDKSFAVMQHYNFRQTAATLSLAKNDEERNMILIIESMRNPAPDLNTIKQVYNLDSNSVYFSFLVQREINKLEDWIFTPKYSSSKIPSVSFDQMSWYDNYEKAKTDNFNKDIFYLKELREFLIGVHAKVSGEQKDFISSAIAQLCFIDDEIDLGKKYVAMISDKANTSIQLQKNIQLALVALKQDDLQDKNTQKNLFNYFNAIENLVEKDNSLLKNLYSLYRIASNEFSKQGDKATAGLLFLKSNLKKEASDSWYYDVPSFYQYIGYFERFATLDDMDNLIALYQKVNKTPFEKYICAGTIAPDVNYYRDVKGTIAFRKNNLAVAYQIFASMPANFWQKNYEYKTYLNEDPFTPKVLQKQRERKFNYHFNKAEFVARLIELKKENTVKSNLLLGHAYFNVSYWGNSWMMIAYDWSSYGNKQTYSDYVYGENNYDAEMKYQNSNYYRCTLAKMYYEKALKMSKNKEEKALASLMIFECNYYDYYRDFIISEDERVAFKTGKEITNFYTVYNTTKTFKQYNCLLLEAFIK